jgi:hypothetical protein
MLILKYFLVVGAVLTAGLIALNAHLLPAGSTSSAPVYSATSASLPDRRAQGAASEHRRGFSCHADPAAGREVGLSVASLPSFGSRPSPFVLTPGRRRGFFLQKCHSAEGGSSAIREAALTH